MTTGEDILTKPETPTWWWVFAGLFSVAVVLFCVGLLWEEATEGDLFTWLLYAGLLLLSGLGWLVFAWIGAFNYRKNYRKYVLGVVAPVVVVTSGALVWSGAAEAVAWRVSKGALERAAADCVQNFDNQRFGVYTITAVSKADGGCQFRTEGGFLDFFGFAYLPGGIPAGVSRSTTYTAFDGPWYRFRIEWD